VTAATVPGGRGGVGIRSAFSLNRKPKFSIASAAGDGKEISSSMQVKKLQGYSLRYNNIDIKLETCHA
jgi:hypothetical protein